MASMNAPDHAHRQGRQVRADQVSDRLRFEIRPGPAPGLFPNNANRARLQTAASLNLRPGETNIGSDDSALSGAGRHYQRRDLRPSGFRTGAGLCRDAHHLHPAGRVRSLWRVDLRHAAGRACARHCLSAAHLAIVALVLDVYAERNRITVGFLLRQGLEKIALPLVLLLPPANWQASRPFQASS